MAYDGGGCLRSDLAVRPGKFVKKYLLSAVSSVDSTGENSAPCEKATICSGVAEPIAALACSSKVGARICHNRVAGVRMPVKATLFLYFTVTVVASNVTSQPASHNCPMEIKVWS